MMKASACEKIDSGRPLVAQALCLCGFAALTSGAQPRVAVLLDFFRSL